MANGVSERQPSQAWIDLAVAILTLQAIAINRLAGIDYPIWALRDGHR